MTPGVLFDMDGVLVASGPAHAASWRMVARRQGVNFTDSQFKQTFGQTSRDIIRALWGPDLTDAEIARIDDEKEAAYRELITGMVPLTIGVRETLNGLRQAEFPLAVATSGPPANVDLVLDECGLRAHFSAIVTGRDIQRGKPAPDCFVLAAERLGRPPANCVVIEDAPVGIQAGRAAGAKVIGFVGSHPEPALRNAGADVVVSRLGDITPALLRRTLGLESRA